MSQKIIGAIITDCHDDNAKGRQTARFAALFGAQPTFIGVSGPDPEATAAGNLIDVLDALRVPGIPDIQAIVLVNVAPRGLRKDPQWNGTPFGYFTVGGTIVVSTLGRCLTLVRDLELAGEINVFDLPSVTSAAIDWGDITPEQAARINQTQFRSYEFAPLAAWWLHQGRPVPVARTVALGTVGDVDNTAWAVDNFGNVKTTIVRSPHFTAGHSLTLVSGEHVACYDQLTLVPAGQAAIVPGSSGYGDKRFLELVIQRGDAAAQYKVAAGQKILAEPLKGIFKS